VSRDNLVALVGAGGGSGGGGGSDDDGEGGLNTIYVQ